MPFITSSELFSRIKALYRKTWYLNNPFQSFYFTPSKKFPVLIAFISISLSFHDRELHNFPTSRPTLRPDMCPKEIKHGIRVTLDSETEPRGKHCFLTNQEVSFLFFYDVFVKLFVQCHRNINQISLVEKPFAMLSSEKRAKRNGRI